MTLSSVAVAKQRPTKTRSKRQPSTRPALAVSTLHPTALDLSPGKEHLVCPDCATWTPITGVRSTPHLVPHHIEPAGTPGPPRRCIGTNRRLILDITVARWQRRFTEGGVEAAARRSTKVLPKPVAPVAPPVSEMRPARLSPVPARRAYLAHRDACPACTDTAHCTLGATLATTLLRLLRQEPERRRGADLIEEFAREVAARRARQEPRRRSAEWVRVSRSVDRVDEARRQQLSSGGAPSYHRA
ncbi:hypothetical protein [Embleya hyalina]|uniref:Uncharacterized protein n=1 Tax=Embleya hyalina TaxID=516124 RepID=A0A401YYP9_9ACTN|nr:hypothetical protein [Embleya hyalina]GCD99727.1 hypothetical protein EHYA_07449 [Embleya hyalina]